MEYDLKDLYTLLYSIELHIVDVGESWMHGNNEPNNQGPQERHDVHILNIKALGMCYLSNIFSFLSRWDTNHSCFSSSSRMVLQLFHFEEDWERKYSFAQIWV